MTETQHNPVAETLARIEERAEAATPGPWSCWSGWRTVDRTGHGDSPIMGMFRIGSADNYSGGVWTYGDAEDIYATLADAEFIAAARTDLPALLAFARAVLAMIKAAEELGSDAHSVTSGIRDALQQHLGGQT